MIGCGTRTFTDPCDFCAQARGFETTLTLTGHAPFRTYVAWVDLPCLRLSMIEESAARIGFLSPPDGHVLISFPVRSESPTYWNGVLLGRGDVAVHAPGEHFHQHATGPLRWGLIAVATPDFNAYSGALLGEAPTVVRGPAILRLPKAAATDLLRLHREACRLAEAHPGRAAHREVARALEQDLMATLISGLAATGTVNHDRTRRRHAAIMARFEDVLGQLGNESLSAPDLARKVGVPERTLHHCCASFLGRGPVSYARLRRLNLARSALAHGTSPTGSVAAIARAHGFPEPGRFSIFYRGVFGETPSTTLHRSRSTTILTRRVAGE